MNGDPVAQTIRRKEGQINLYKELERNNISTRELLKLPLLAVHFFKLGNGSETPKMH